MSKVQIKIKDVLKDLEDGMSREEIGTKYGLTTYETRRMFMHEKLKGKRPKPAVKFVLIDEPEEEVTVTEEKQEPQLSNSNEGAIPPVVHESEEPEEEPEEKDDDDWTK